eukprot:703897-Rhodomonas_salina.1
MWGLGAGAARSGGSVPGDDQPCRGLWLCRGALPDLHFAPRSECGVWSADGACAACRRKT